MGVRLLRVWHAGMHSLLLYSLYHNTFYVRCGRDDQGALPRMIGSDRSCACGRSAASRGKRQALVSKRACAKMLDPRHTSQDVLVLACALLTTYHSV